MQAPLPIEPANEQLQLKSLASERTSHILLFDMLVDLNVPYFKSNMELRKTVLTLPECKEFLDSHCVHNLRLAVAVNYDGCALNHELRGRVTAADVMTACH